ncbi:hypothetical protein GLOTRDRAFT_140314 [Gloeophyllum trabeum ATCC 11539]|uniref:SH3 domain-containing protein n=1 Tax=Gloeophyllum trabeum (strain ATCC 11539 / FP-39264 / Madison 617) TaxID=670483 RepID=S7RJ40_GLOTA|nr:uncharacterized protein GLOTRDRAFT_140314 [Gloeophyllum trabeum ATCC 11539]EPQ52639.1 hypothetical protein GLOTRDRAFT_140314 [Gloeophyllum trabeum ATCC 11539]
MPPSVLVPRDDETSSSLSSSNMGIIIAGFVIAGVIVLGLAAYFGLRFIRKRSKKQREENRGAAFLNVRGIVEEKEDKEPPPSILVGIHGETFSRNNLAAKNVVMPAKTIRPDASRDEILDYYSSSGSMPKPFRPFSFALNAPHLTPPSPTHDGASRRSSVGSFLSVARHSIMSVGSNRLSTASSLSFAGDSAQRKVRQTFDPVLPDELVVALGEQLTVVQSFDDGWCVVGRSSVFNPGEVEMGAVPAWAFLKPVKGLRAERPMRVSSLGVSIQLDAGPGFSSRDECVSWSNVY